MDRKERKRLKKERKKGWPTASSKNTGLDELRPLDHIWVELLLESVDPKKKFTVRDPSGELLFYGGERQENFSSNGRGRRFHMTLLNQDMEEVVSVYRKEVTIWLGCFCSTACAEQMKVVLPGRPEKLLGTIAQQTKMTPGVILEVRNAKNVLELKLRGPKTRFTCCGLWEKRFEIMDPADKVIGAIKQDLSSSFAHNFSLSFPVVLDEKIKTVLIGVCFMISVRNNNVKNDGYEYVYVQQVPVEATQRNEGPQQSTSVQANTQPVIPPPPPPVQVVQPIQQIQPVQVQPIQQEPLQPVIPEEDKRIEEGK